MKEISQIQPALRLHTGRDTISLCQSFPLAGKLAAKNFQLMSGGAEPGSLSPSCPLQPFVGARSCCADLGRFAPARPMQMLAKDTTQLGFASSSLWAFYQPWRGPQREREKRSWYS